MGGAENRNPGCAATPKTPQANVDPGTEMPPDMEEDSSSGTCSPTGSPCPQLPRITILLPGEQNDNTVYLIDFYDRCRYFGFTKEPVFYRAASLAANIASWGTNSFVEEHAARVPYAIRCIKSGLNDLQARRLRDMLVAQAPENVVSPAAAASCRRPTAG